MAIYPRPVLQTPMQATWLALLLIFAASTVEQVNAAQLRSTAVAVSDSDAGIVIDAKMMCLSNGTGVDCVNPLDPRQCTPRASEWPAITFTFDMNVPWKYDEAWCQKLKRMADAMAADLVLLLPSTTAANNRIEFPENVMAYLPQYFRIVRTPWVVPPDLSPDVPRDGGCCGAREFMKLYSLALDEYDAVVNLDTDMEIHGSLRPLFDCAASGKFLTARGSKSGVNGGMFAVRPSQTLLQQVLADLQVSSASEQDGWNKLGLAPGAKYGQAGLQGFLYYFFYQRPYQRNISAMTVMPGQVDPCAWTGAIFCKTSACEVTPLRHKIRCPAGVEPPMIDPQSF